MSVTWTKGKSCNLVPPQLLPRRHRRQVVVGSLYLPLHSINGGVFHEKISPIHQFTSSDYVLDNTWGSPLFLKHIPSVGCVICGTWHVINDVRSTISYSIRSSSPLTARPETSVEYFNIHKIPLVPRLIYKGTEILL